MVVKDAAATPFAVCMAILPDRSELRLVGECLRHCHEARAGVDGEGPRDAVDLRVRENDILEARRSLAAPST
jgi:hypothetical protein